MRALSDNEIKIVSGGFKGSERYIENIHISFQISLALLMVAAAAAALAVAYFNSE